MIRSSSVKGSLLVLVVGACLLLVAGCGGSGSPAPPQTKGDLDVAIKVLKHGKQVIALVPVTIDGHGP